MQNFPEFLKKKLPNLIKDNTEDSNNIQKTVEKHNRLHTDKIKEGNINASIEAYIDRLENIFLNKDEKTRKRNLEMLRSSIHDALLIKKENFPESYFDLQRQVARNMGHGDVEISVDQRERMMDTAIQDQRVSLDSWIDYLTSEDATYLLPGSNF